MKIKNKKKKSCQTKLKWNYCKKIFSLILLWHSLLSLVLLASYWRRGEGWGPRFFLSFPFLHYNNKLLLLLILFLYQFITVHSNKSSYLSFFMRFVFTKVLFCFFFFGLNLKTSSNQQINKSRKALDLEKRKKKKRVTP